MNSWAKLSLIAATCWCLGLLGCMDSCGGPGTRMEFKKGELYYDEDTVSKERAQDVGEALVVLGVFNDEQRATVKLDTDDSGKVYRVHFVINKEDAEDARPLLKLWGRALQLNAFHEDDFEIHLCNQRLESYDVISSFEEEPMASSESGSDEEQTSGE